MKLQHLVIGARFEYEGVVFVKTGPLTASAESGGQRLIPRYAELRPLDVPAVEPERKGKRLIERDKVTQAFDAFFASCEGLVESDTGRAELIAARQRFIQSVG